MTTKVRFLDLAIKDLEERKAILASVEQVLIHGMIIQGPEVEQLERKIAQRFGRKYAIGVSSGSDAVYLGLKGLGIGEGDEVITTSLCVSAPATAIAMTGAKPVFADVDNYMNIDPKSVRRLVTDKTKAIFLVHYAGRIGDIDALLELAKKYRLLILEDISQAFGATKVDKTAGKIGDVSVLSINSMKILSGLGEAGMIFTDNISINNRIKNLHYNGMKDPVTCTKISLNHRLDTIQAAIILRRLETVDALIEKRNKIARFYNHTLKDVVEVLSINENETISFYYYNIFSNRRDGLLSYLLSNGVEAQARYPLLLPEQPAFKESKAEYSKAKERFQKVLCLPAHQNLTNEEIKYVAKCIITFYKR